MSKQATPRALADNQAKAFVKTIKTSPQKLNLVAAQIRSLPVNRALEQLTFSKKKVANDIKHALNSAIANAENNHGLDIDKLIVKEAYVGKSIVMKRFRARARGRGFGIKKPFSNLTIVVEEV